MSRGANMAFSKGMICVTSAGNSGGSSNPYVAAVPAEASYNLAVGAVKEMKICFVWFCWTNFRWEN